MSIKQAMLFVKEDSRQVALKGVSIDVEVKEFAGITTLTQEFENTEEKAIEAVYLFPVEESAAVIGFEIETGGRTIKGITEEREKAFEIYDKAIEEGNAGFLLDQELGDVLNISVGNILPGQKVKVTLRYVTGLPINDGVMRLQIPASVSPRYIPAGTDPVKADTLSSPYSLDAPYKLSLNVNIRAEGIEEVVSPSHKIITEQMEGGLKAGLADKCAALDRDFILEIRLNHTKDPVCVLAEHENTEKAVLLRFFPEFDEFAPQKESKSEVIFILDCSGSMGGSSIKEAKEALDISLRSLNKGDLFNIIRFGSTYEVYSKEPVSYNEKTFKKAIAYINSIDANLGGTELLAPFQFVCGMPVVKGYTRDVILLTDGEVSNPDAVIKLAASASDRLRVFTFGIGYGASHHLVKGTARATNGAFEMIQPGEKIQPKVLRQFSRISQPSLADIKVTAEGCRLTPPSRFAQLFEGDSYSLFAKVDGDVPSGAEIVFSAQYLDQPYNWKAKIGRPVKDNAIPSLWALSRIKDLKESDTTGSNQEQRKIKAVEKEITELGLKFNILTEFTSYIAIEERKQKDRTNERPEYRRIPVQLTKDWHGIGYGEAEEQDFAGLDMSPASPAMYSQPRKSAGGLFTNLLSGIDFKMKKKTSGKRGSPVDSRSKESGKNGGDSDWYLDLLKTQQASGCFTGLDIVAEKLGKDAREIKALIGKMDAGDKELCEKILTTYLAVYLLHEDKTAFEASKRAVKKAKSWLSGQVKFTIGGKPVEEVLKNEWGIVL
ncbi:MAG: VWA domain-containing protein [Spirochaetales bacterium]|nr:VWA domain-containing protein [Spirochaetales bacterium]